MTESEIRGFLTESDKKWLNEEVVYKHRQTEADRRAQIRERVSAALKDFSELNRNWSSDERRKMLDDLENPEKIASEIIEFLYVLLNERASDPEALIVEDPLDTALAFRQGLSLGIRQGKDHFGSSPSYALIDSNTELFELPTKKEFLNVLNTEQWRRANNHVRGAIDKSDDTVIDKEDAADQYLLALNLAIEEWLVNRRGSPRVEEIDRHDGDVMQYGPSLDSSDSNNE